MKTIIHPRALLLIGTLLCTPLLAQTATPTKAEVAARKTAIGESYKAAKAACASLKANAKDVCREEAKAKEKDERAELVFSESGRPADGTRMRVVKADGIYEVAKERCDDASGNAKDGCRQEAKAAHVTAIANAKLVKVTTDARADAKEEIHEAQYKVDVEKCDAMSGDRKTACVDAAKKAHGKL